MPSARPPQMPMKNDSTPLKSEVMSSATVAGQQPEKCAPRKSTIALPRQFARAYTCAATVPVAIGSFVAN